MGQANVPLALGPMDQEPAGLALLTALITAKPADVLEVGSLAMQRANFAQALRSPLTAPSEPLFAEPADDDATSRRFNAGRDL